MREDIEEIYLNVSAHARAGLFRLENFIILHKRKSSNK